MAQESLKQLKLVIIGGSSGSLEVLVKVLPLLKSNTCFAIVLVLHRNTISDSGLTDLLATRTSLRVKEAEDKDSLLAGTIYVAPPDYHLLVEADNTLSLDASEKVHFCRPSIDVTYLSAAVALKEGLAVMLLSGANSDGAAGIRAVHKAGGFTIVQDPAEAGVAYMPEQALLTNAVDVVMKSEDIATWLNEHG